MALVGGALAPRLAHLARWPGRARGKALFAYWLWSAALTYVMRYVVARKFREAGTLRQQTVADLQAEFGREPTEQELSARFTARRAEAKRLDPRRPPR